MSYSPFVNINALNEVYQKMKDQLGEKIYKTSINPEEVIGGTNDPNTMELLDSPYKLAYISSINTETGTETKSAIEEGWSTGSRNYYAKWYINKDGVIGATDGNYSYTISPSAVTFDGTLTVTGATTFISPVYNAVWNDLVDMITVPEDTELEYGYCYSYNNGKYYKTNRYGDKNFFGIHSDTSGMKMGCRSGVKQLESSVAGYVLVYVDKEYESGTPLVCTKNGYLTKARLFDRLFNSYKVIATYWKKEESELYENKVVVNDRHWVKIK